VKDDCIRAIRTHRWGKQTTKDKQELTKTQPPNPWNRAGTAQYERYGGRNGGHGNGEAHFLQSGPYSLHHDGLVIELVDRTGTAVVAQRLALVGYYVTASGYILKGFHIHHALLCRIFPIQLFCFFAQSSMFRFFSQFSKVRSSDYKRIIESGRWRRIEE